MALSEQVLPPYNVYVTSELGLRKSTCSECPDVGRQPGINDVNSTSCRRIGRSSAHARQTDAGRWNVKDVQEFTITLPHFSSPQRQLQQHVLADRTTRKYDRLLELPELDKIPVRQRIDYKLAVLTYKTRSTSTPSYLSRHIRPRESARHLRSCTSPLYCTSQSPEPASPIVLSVAQHPLFGTLWLLTLQPAVH